MRAVVFEDRFQIAVKDVRQPAIENPTDALLRVTTSGICGSDLHMYEGRTGLKKGTVIGHEIMGVIEQVGDAVQSIAVGDRVVLPFNVGCGFCFNCERGFANFCLTVNPEKAHAAYGYAGMGPFSGGQAEFVRVPFADFNCLKLPGAPGDEFEDDFLLLSDVFPTGYHGAQLAHVGPGSSVAVFGAGPVGLLAAYSSVLKGAAQVFIVDAIAGRLEKADELGAIPINLRDGDPVDQILAFRREDEPFQQSLRPGEEKMAGVMCGIDAVGYQARGDANYGEESPTQVLDNLARVVNPTGHVGLVGVYMAPDPLAKDEPAKRGIFPFPIAQFFDKGIAIGMGQTPVKRYNAYLRDLIIAGVAKPSSIISHRIPIEQVPDAYQKFDQRADGYTKVLIKMAA